MFDARPILAGIWRRLRANRTPLTDITAQIDPTDQPPPRPVRPQALTTRARANVLEPYSWDTATDYTQEPRT